MKILFVGASWLGSDARTLKEAISRSGAVALDEVNEDLYYPYVSDGMLRVAVRALRPLFREHLFRQVRTQVQVSRPDVILIVKGTHFSAAQVDELKALGPKIVLRFPDACPLTHGKRLQRAVGHYDLVISAKPLHPGMWQGTYGYTNRCVCVPHGYNPALHLRENYPEKAVHDVVLVALARPEYVAVIDGLARSEGTASLRVAICGNDWHRYRDRFPGHWEFFGPVMGEAYVDALRSAKIAIAPITTRILVNGKEIPGDVDTARTYELAAASCFFIHRRSDYVASIYDERTEVPLFSDGDELAAKVAHFVRRADDRRRMADAAHRRAVPAYSIDARAAEMIQHLKSL